MRAHPSPADFMILAGVLFLLVFPGCTVVNYCIGTHMDEWRAERHAYRKGDDHMVRAGHAVTVITTGGTILHGKLVGTRTADDRAMALAGSDHAVTEGNLPLSSPGSLLAPATEYICMAMPDSTTLEIPVDEVYLVRAEYGPPHLWRRTLPIPGLIFDAAAILVISGAAGSQ